MEGTTRLHAAASPEDRELVERFRKGTDREASFLALFERYGVVTHAFFRRRVGDPQIAADLNQDLYLDVLEGLGGFRGEASFRTWLFRLAHNRISHLRRRWSTHLDEWTSARAGAEGQGAPETLWENLEGTGELPDQAAARNERERRLAACLCELPEIERAVVLGQYYQGLTLEELTGRLQLSNPSGARAALIAAQRRLRRCLERGDVRAGGRER